MIEKTIYKKDTKLECGILYTAQDGVYRFADNKMYSAVVKVEEPHEGDELKPSIQKIKLPKLPYELFNKVYEFFKYVYKKHKSEVAILLWHNFETGEWDIEVPKQTVSGASVNYVRDESWGLMMNDSGYVCVGTIHSHCEMTAFHSGTDDHDEYNFDGVHITIGKVISGPEFAQRFIVKKMSHKFNDIFDVVEKPDVEEIVYPTEWNTQVTKTTYTYKPKSSLGGYQSKTVNMKFNSDGSLRLPTLDEETDEVEEQITEEEKAKRAFEKFSYMLNKYKCPVCGKHSTKEEVTDYICPSCYFPMYDNEDDYLLEEHSGFTVAMKDDLEDISKELEDEFDYSKEN